MVEGWQFSGKMFWRTGLPFTIVDGNLGGTIVNGGDSIPGTIIGNAQPGSCGGGNASYDGLGNPGCLSAAGLLDVTLTPALPAVDYSTQRRGQYRGPHYFDMDLNLFKNFKVAERFNLAIGAQAFNVFNHPNFGIPNSDFFTGRSDVRNHHHRCSRRRPVRTATSWALTHLRASCSSARRSCSRREE